jgi:hypothetical protein
MFAFFQALALQMRRCWGGKKMTRLKVIATLPYRLTYTAQLAQLVAVERLLFMAQATLEGIKRAIRALRRPRRNIRT